MCRDSALRFLALTGIVALGLSVAGDVVGAQAPPPQRVTHAGAGVSIAIPAGWRSLRALPTEDAGTRPTPAERQAVMQRLAGNPEGLFVFVEPPGTLDPSQTARIAITVMSTGAMSGRPANDLVAVMNAQANPMLTAPAQIARVSGMPAAHAVMRQPITWRDSTFPALSRAWFVPREAFTFMIEMAAPEDRSGALEATFAEVLASIRIDE